jgi:multimeric flavodoxin WrbA
LVNSGTQTGAQMQATIFIGSLKKEPSDSNTTAMSKQVKTELESYGVNVTLRYLRNRRMAHGVEFDTGEDFDEMKVYYNDVDKSDIIILATPIWWGVHSSLCQQWMERIGAYDDEYIKTGKSKLYNKVFGCIITASNDGFQHIEGIFYSFATNIGMTVPPEVHVTWGTEIGKIDNPETQNQKKNAARNLFLWAKTIGSIKLGDRALQIKPGRVGLDNHDKLESSDKNDEEK